MSTARSCWARPARRRASCGCACRSCSPCCWSAPTSSAPCWCSSSPRSSSRARRAEPDLKLSLAISVPVYVGLAVFLGAGWGTAGALRALRWSIDDREPNEQERLIALGVPWFLTRIQAGLWLGGTVLFTLLTALFQPARAVTTALTVGIASLVVGGHRVPVHRVRAASGRGPGALGREAVARPWSRRTTQDGAVLVARYRRSRGRPRGDRDPGPHRRRHLRHQAGHRGPRARRRGALLRAAGHLAQRPRGGGSHPRRPRRHGAGRGGRARRRGGGVRRHRARPAPGRVQPDGRRTPRTREAARPLRSARRP